MAKATKILDKINDHQGTDWYSEKQIYDLLQHYVGSDHIHIFQALSTKDQLSYQLSQLQQLNKPQYIVPLNVSALTGELGHGNHWVGLHIQLNNSSNSLTVNYLNPMGYPINDGVCDAINQALSHLFTTVTIDQPLLNHGIQIAHKVSDKELVGNLNDCGPMLVYIMTCRTRTTDLIKIGSQVESESLGAFLRKSFTNQEDFNTIYATLCKNPGNRAASEAKKIAVNNYSDSNYSQATKAKEKFNKKPAENKLSTDVNREQPAETPFTDTFKEMHRQYQKGNELLRQQYKDKLKREVIANLSKNKEELVKIFLQITDSTITTAEAAIHELKLYYYNDAASACHYVLKIEEDDFSKTEAHKRLNIIQNNIVKLCGASPDALSPITGQADIDRLCHRKELQALRDLTRQSLKELEEIKEKDEKLYIDKTATLFKTIASGMEQYLAGLYKEAEDMLGTAPCKYTVIGFGSMALRQTTPYSDLECAILTENDNYRQSGDHLTRNYFKNLSHLVHFMIINLGETIIPTSRYGFDLSEFIPQAVNFDLGGKTPLGRIEQDKPYDLVQTVEGMLRYLRNEGQKTERMDKNLPNILQKTCFVHGDKDLAEGYQSQAEKFLRQPSESGRPNCEARAIKVLSEGVVECDYTKVDSSSKLIKGDLEMFGFNPYKAQGKLFDVKQEIYRLPDRLIYYLGLIHGVQKDGSWDTLDKLQNLEKISPEGTSNLKKALTFATNLRLKTYDHYGYQKETIDFSKVYKQNQTESEELIEAISDTFRLKKEDLKPDRAFFEYYKVILSLHKKLWEFCTKEDAGNKDDFFANEVFYSNDPGTIAEIHLRLLQYEAALEQQLLALEVLEAMFELKHPNAAIKLDNVGLTYSALGKHDLAIRYHLEALEFMKKLLGPEHPDVAISLNNMGCTYSALGNHKEALEYQLKALAMQEKVLGKEHPGVAESLNNVGMTYGGLGKHDKALKYSLEALKLMKKLLGHEHPLIATSLNNMGCTYGALGNHKEALEYQLKALTMRKKLLGPEHPNVATSLNNVGGTYKYLGNHREALKYLLESLELMRKLLGPEHPNVATSLSNVGSAYGALGNHQEALRYELEALELMRKTLGQEHPAVATSLDKVGTTYFDLGKHELALRYQLEALELNKKSLGQEHPDIAVRLNNVGYTYCALGECEIALSYNLKALEMRKKLLGRKHPDVATSLNNVGMTYGGLGKHELALQHKLEALEMRKKLLGHEHSLVATSLNNVGMTYDDLGKHELALQHKLESLELMRKLLGPEHPNVATSLNNVGTTYCRLGQHELALQYQLESLELMRKLFGQEHPYVAASLSNVGGTYYELGQHEEALEYQLKALELGKKLLGATHPQVLTIQQNVKFMTNALELQSKHKAVSAMECGKEYYLKGQYPEAIDAFKKVLNLPYLENNIKISLLYNLARAYHQNKDLVQAMDYYNKVLELNSSHAKVLGYVKELITAAAQLSVVLSINNLNNDLTNDQLKKILDEALDVYQLEAILDESLEIYLNDMLSSRHKEMPLKTTGAVRIVSYNVTADYFDDKDKTADSQHHWKFRSPFVVKLLESVYPDIICLQELSPNQALELHEYFGNRLGYSSVFLSQTPSEIEAGLIAFGDKVGNWCGKNIGTPLVGTFISKGFKLLEWGRFWLNEEPDVVPTNADRGEIDKGFGNMNTYRAVLWAKVQVLDEKALFVFNSHYPLSGGNKARLECTKLEMAKIKEITQGTNWISAGDRNIMSTKEDTNAYNPATLHQEFAKHGMVKGDGINHYGVNTTWIGFSYDHCQNQVREGKFQDEVILDVIVSSLKPVCSFFLHGALDPENQELLPLLGALGGEQNEGRYFASDHALAGVDIIWL